VKKIFFIIFILFITSRVHAVNVNAMTPLYWSTAFSPENDIKEHADLVFSKPIVYNNDTRWVNQIFLPNDKPGQFPVIVIMPDCGSVGPHNLDFMQKAFERGYAAIVLDHHRGFRINCGNSRDKPVKWLRMTKDAYDLATYLETLSNIDKKRIYSIGGSEGGMIGGFLSSPGIKKFTAPNAPRYRANASFYGCAVFPIGSSGPNNTKDHMYIFNDLDRPLLWLMGEADNECITKEDLLLIKYFQQLKLPIHYHLYKDATHCWDCKNKNGLRQTMYRFGSQVTVTYTFDQNVTNDSINRVLDFFDKYK
jgi:dienelactone hydrolase